VGRDPTNLSQARIGTTSSDSLYRRRSRTDVLDRRALSIVSALLVLSGWQVELGVYGLMLFLVLATGLLLRFWEAPNPMARNGMRLAL
jgi:hypothetical protein